MKGAIPRTRVPLLLTLILLLFAASAPPAAAVGEDPVRPDARSAETGGAHGSDPGVSRPNHYIGLELGFALIPFGFEDPYSAPIGLGLFYELHSFLESIPLFAGFHASYYDFNPLNVHFGQSYMIQIGLYVGYDFLFPFGVTSALVLSPYVGYKHYFREHVYWSDTILTNRPILMAGIRVDLQITRRFFFGIGLEYDIILDRSPLHTLYHTDRIGVAF